MRWALNALVVQHLTVAGIAEVLAIARGTANKAVLAEGEGRVIGIDEHVWRHTRKGDKYDRVIIDITPIRDGTQQSRLWTCLGWS